MASSLLFLGVLVLSGATFSLETEVVVLRAVRGLPARLPCGQGRVFLDGPEAYVLWLKNDRDLLYRFPNDDADRRIERRLPSNCEGENCRDETALVIKRVSEQDGGIYRCRVHYQASPSVDYVIDVRLVDSPGTPRIVDENDDELTKGYVGPLAVGADLTLVCEVDEDETDTLVYWRRNGVAVERYAAGATRVVMRARNVTRDELDAHYECVAQNADVTEPLTASVVVKMYLPPLSVEIRLNHNVEFEAGQPRVVDCVVVGCVPPPSITWHLGDNQLRPTVHKELHDGNYTVSSLTLAPSLRDNGNQLVCRAHNTELPDEVYDDKVTIHVGFRPVCLTTRAQVVGVAARQAETLTCVVEASPEPLSVSWTFENTRTLYTSVKKVPGHLNRYSSTLTWMGQDTDIGLLLCRATNSYGEQKQACVYSVSYGGPPEQPTCDIFRSYPSLLRVQCKKGWDGGRPQRMALEVYAGSGMLLHNLTDAAGYFEVNDIFESKNYSAVVYASSVRGRSQPVHLNLHSVTTHVASAVTEDTTASSFVMLGWLQIVIGSTILLVILIAATLCMRISQTRRLSMENNPDLVPRTDGRVYDCLRATTEVLGVALAVAASTVVNTLRADHYDCDFEDVIQVLDKQGSFHREPDFTQERVLGSTNITVNQLAACPNAYSGPPVPIRVMPGCTLHTTPKFCANEQQSYFV
ncbi:hypothetical protein JYU34_000172 [Plutella xylostella]|uniref:Ig-like domain-containing protein n=1 Tax=Plutella xylostella TaxID=51655 RepID=A0ABQ7R707_PLUXY|nr:hypothetical protein JYU34_000172 [Plutella xylostella]